MSEPTTPTPDASCHRRQCLICGAEIPIYRMLCSKYTCADTYFRRQAKARSTWAFRMQLYLLEMDLERECRELGIANDSELSYR